MRASSYQDATLTEQKVEGSDALRFRRLDEVLTAMETAQPRPFFPGRGELGRPPSAPTSAPSRRARPVEQGLAAADAAVDKSLSK